MFDFFKDFGKLVSDQQHLAWDFMGKHPVGSAVFFLVCLGVLVAAHWCGYRAGKRTRR